MKTIDELFCSTRIWRDDLIFIIFQGGWELDESVEEAASRESLEEAGVLGNVEVSAS